jgi:hypothetical protein
MKIDIETLKAMKDIMTPPNQHMGQVVPVATPSCPELVLSVFVFVSVFVIVIGLSSPPWTVSPASLIAALEIFTAATPTDVARAAGVSATFATALPALSIPSEIAPLGVGVVASSNSFLPPIALDKSLTIAALVICILMIISPRDLRMMLLTFVAGTALGYFLELWGTTRLCWIYYTYEQPPLFAVLAHGMAAVAFWRTEVLIKDLAARWWPRPAEAAAIAAD